MNILYVLHQFFPNHHTGTERLTLQLAKQNQKMSNFVYILTYEPNNLGIEGFQKLDENFLVKTYQVETVPVIAFKKRKEGWKFDVFDLLLEKHLRKIVEKFDVVHFTHPWRFGSVLKICRELKIPTVLTLTDTWLLCPQNLLTINNDLCSGPEGGKKCSTVCNYEKKIIGRYKDAKFFFDNIDIIFSGSKFLPTVFSENNWKRTIEINPFSIDYSDIKPVGEPKEIVFGFLGSLMWHKGLHILLNAFKKIEDNDVKLKIYGKGAEGNSYSEKTLKSIEEDKRIEYCGTFDYKELPKVMRDLSVIIIPSMHKENFPLSMQIAFAYKKPIIATKIGGMPEVVKDKVNGFLFDYADENQLFDIISTIVKNPKIINTLKENIENPPKIEKEAFEYERAYRELIYKDIIQRDRKHG